MAEKTGIAWTTSTFNAWIGCTKVGPGCDNCYAEATDKLRRWGGATHWGPGVPRKVMADSYWTAPPKWNKAAKESGQPHRVFCSSLADVFDNEAPEGQRERLWAMIRATPYLTWQLVTKRIGNAASMLPPDWGAGYPNVHLLATIVNQEEADRDIFKLLSLPARVRGVSYEPALGPVNWMPYLTSGCLHWIIVGGESKQESSGKRGLARFNVGWAIDTIDQCKATHVPVFIKQLGAAPYVEDALGEHLNIVLKDTQAGADIDEWPPGLKLREFPPTYRPQELI
jgi:protein gp37